MTKHSYYILFPILITSVIFFSGCFAFTKEEQQIKEQQTQGELQESKEEKKEGEKIEPNENQKEEKEGEQETVRTFQIIARQWEFEPSVIRVTKGDKVRLLITSMDVNHSFVLPEYEINKFLAPGQTAMVEFVADKAGEFTFQCMIYCGSGHGQMRGTLEVHE